MADDSGFEYECSWATEPLFYRAPAPPNMRPHEYQLAGVEYHLGRANALFGDAPGLGKSAESILLGNAIEARRSLIVCPASLRLNWEREVWAWSTLPNVSTYPVLKASDGVSSIHNYVILSWSLLAKPEIHAAVMAERWDHVILDEAHAIKDPSGNSRSKAVCGWVDHGTYRPGVCDVAGRITAASGTITPNQPVEVYNIARLLDHSCLDHASLEDFREFYYDKGEGFITRRVYDPAMKKWGVKREWSNSVRNQPRNLEDLQRRLRSKIMVRRLKEDVLKELPPKTWHVFPLAMTAEIKRALKHPGWSEAARLYEMDPEAFNAGIPIDGEISTARRLLGEAKAPAVADYIEDLLDSGVQKVVVGALHRSVLDILRKRLEGYGLTYMDGGTSSAGKQRAADLFQMDDRIRIILGQTYVIGEGWTLTAAQDAVLAEPDYVPGRNDQFLDRIHRMGQKGSYLIGHVPVCPDTLDERVVSTAVRKDQHIHAMMDRRVL